MKETLIKLSEDLIKKIDELIPKFEKEILLYFFNKETDLINFGGGFKITLNSLENFTISHDYYSKGPEHFDVDKINLDVISYLNKSCTFYNLFKDFPSLLSIFDTELKYLKDVFYYELEKDFYSDSNKFFDLTRESMMLYDRAKFLPINSSFKIDYISILDSGVIQLSCDKNPSIFINYGINAIRLAKKIIKYG